LPTGLETLKLGDAYDIKFIKGILPDGLQKLKLGNRYKYEFTKGVLPDSLIELELGAEYNQKIDFDIWPQSINGVILVGTVHNIPIINNLPYINKITFINLQVEVSNLPPTIQTIRLINKEGESHLKKIPFGCEIIYK
jgi:hypothetical protein